MARQLLIGAGTAVSYSSAGDLASGAIDVQKESASGAHTSVDASSDTNLTAPRVRIVQGTGTGGNIYSPWIDVRNVIHWKGEQGAVQTAQVGTLVFTVASTGAYTLECKLINKTNGVSPFQMKSYEIAVASGTAFADVSAALGTAVNADLPHWIKSFSDSSGTITVTGYKKGEAKADGSIQGENVLWDFVDNSGDFLGTVLAVDIDATSKGTRGVGDPFYVEAFEKSLQGANFGYYNRVENPIAPTTYTDTDGTPADYDMYSLVATKDGSTTSGINGVDNLIEITIAYPQTTTETNAFEDKLNVVLPGFTAQAIT